MVTRAPIHLFNRTITIERATIGSGATGSPQTTWSTHLASVRARLQPHVAKQFVRSGRTPLPRRWRIFVDGKHDITTADRVIFQSTVMEIHDVGDLNEAGTVKVIIVQEAQT